MERARKQIASSIKRNFGDIDCLDEDSILMQLESLLKQQSVDEAGVAAQLKLLRCFRPEHALMQDPEFVDKSGEIAGSDTEDESLPPLSPVSYRKVDSNFLGFFFVSIVGKSCRPLHKGGECHRIPGMHYENFVACGAALPKSDSYSRVCRDCFPQGLCRDMIEESDSESACSKSSSAHSLSS